MPICPARRTSARLQSVSYRLVEKRPDPKMFLPPRQTNAVFLEILDLFGKIPLKFHNLRYHMYMYGSIQEII